MERLIDQLLLIEGAPTPGFLLPAETRLKPFIDELFQRWRVAAPREWSLGAIPDIAVVVDRDRLAISLDELLENAIRHTAEGDRIGIEAVQLADEVLLTVRDSGKGIPPEALGHVFDRFYRVDRDRNRRGGGAGLGLSIVRAVAEAHGGSITVASTPGRRHRLHDHAAGRLSPSSAGSRRRGRSRSGSRGAACDVAAPRRRRPRSSAGRTGTPRPRSGCAPARRSGWAT